MDKLKEISHGAEVIDEMRKRVVSQIIYKNEDSLSKKQDYFIEKFLNEIKKGSSFLDVGCFLGYAYHKLNIEMKKNTDYYGIDMWQEAIQVCREYFMYQKFYFGNAFDISLYAEIIKKVKFDYIWLCQTCRLYSKETILRMRFLNVLKNVS